MADTIDLTARLTKLANAGETYSNGARVIARGGGEEALAAILRAIDDTILMRKLTFRSGRESSLNLVVSGRRIVGVSDVDIPGQTSDTTLLTDPLSEEDDAMMQALTETILAFVQTDGPISVLPVKASRSGGMPTAGLSIRTLADAWGVEMDATPMKRFLRACQDFVPAAVHYKADILANRHGDEATDLQTLAEERAPSAETAYLALYPEQTGGSWLINISYGLKDARCVLLARAGEETGLLTCDSSHLGKVVGNWQRATQHV
ncbi:hypothetical protein [Actibacterium sp. 188UL27-1]|uniref:hypothetical protein n=1 Tax=Actibacterium sp. 188UL27-1 TaxID=2786961 RepID=UPI00195D40DF|nr:hypothetical protein [Actibacterium sp. 188UL27-1]MBM7067982.1 hypothetical protein [Actibacterium sp. 188UL27-1]